LHFRWEQNRGAQPPITRIIGAPQPRHLRRILPDSHLENTATGWSFSSFIAAIVAAHSSRGSKASDFASDKLSDIRYDLDRAVVLALRLEEAEVAPQIDQGGALVVRRSRLFGQLGKSTTLERRSIGRFLPMETGLSVSS
jgi:hypothetical protein